MKQKIVIDTNIWVNSLVEAEYNIDCADALGCFFLDKDLVLALDCNSEIEREYRDNLRDSRFFELRMKQLERENRKYWCDSKLNKKHKDELLKLGFQEQEDHVFAGTAMNADKILITEDSDYGVHGEESYQKVYTYMKQIMGLSVLSSKQFVEMLQEENKKGEKYAGS